MTTAQHDDIATTAVEDALADLDRGAPTPDPATVRPRLAAVDTTALTDGPARSSGRVTEHRGVPARATVPAPHPSRPRLRLVPAPPPVRPAVAPGPTVPTVLSARVRPLPRPPFPADDAEDDRGAVPGTDAGRFVHGVGLACVEVVLGRRPVAQLARWVAPDVLEELQARAALVRRTGVLAHAGRPAARRVRVCPVDTHTAEACLVVDDGVRVRAVAARLEAHRGAWRVTSLQLG